MKFSKYVIIVPLIDKYFLLYNSFTNIYLIISDNTKRIIEDLQIKVIKKTYPKLYEKLCESGSIINCNIDEVELIKQRIDDVDKNPKIYHLIINPTMQCNFRCWYCYENHIGQSKMSPTIIDNTKRLIDNILLMSELEWFSLSFFGGEPLLFYWDVVLPILKYYRTSLDLNNNILGNVSFTTNGYLINKKMIQNFKENGVRNFQITIDGSKEDHDNTRFPYKGGKSFDKIIGNIIELLENDFHVILRLNYTSKNASKMEQVTSLFTSLREKLKKNLIVNFQRVWQDSNSQLQTQTGKYIEKCIEILNQANISTVHGYFNYIWNSCYADKKNEAVINYNGDVFKCTARDFERSKRVGYLSDTGEIIWNSDSNINRFTKPQCHSCRIAPICGGTCLQRHLENINTDKCLLGYDELKKNEIVLDKFFVDVINNYKS